jgi:hypothetical protein
VRNAAAESGEPILPLTEWILTRPSVKKFTINELWAQTIYRETFRMAAMQNWAKSNIDVLLCPPTPGPAALLGTTKVRHQLVFYHSDLTGSTGVTRTVRACVALHDLTDFYIRLQCS